MKKQFAFLVIFSVLIFSSIVPFIANADVLPACTTSDWSCADWGACHADGNYFQNRTCSKITNCEGGVASPSTQQLCTPPFCTSYTYSDWSTCDPVSGTQERSNVSNFPNDCIIDFSGNNPGPITRQRCTPECSSSSWSCGAWGACSSSGSQTRTCTGALNCQGGTASPTTSQSCVFTPPTCTSFTYSNWSSCSSSGNQSRSVVSSLPSSCTGGTPVLSQSCSYVKPLDQQCKDYYGVNYVWNNTTSRCVSPIEPSPVYQQPQTGCTADTWTCGDWNSCLPSGVQGRNCKKTFDCPTVEDSAPATSRSCATPQQTQDQSESINRDQILKATVKLICPDIKDKTTGKQGSGTVIDQYGTILTNRHVIQGTIGSCYVGFINGENDEPIYSEIAYVKSMSTDQSRNGDMAILKISNPKNKQFIAVDILKGNSDNLKSGDNILPFGYPDQNLFGTTITFTEGPYSGRGTTINFKDIKGCDYDQIVSVSGYFKTGAIIDHGSSGGGAYQEKTGFFMGMPTLGTSCDPNIPSRVNYILSVNTIKTWISSIGGSYNVSSNNYNNLGNYLSSAVKIKDANVDSIRILDAPTPVEIVSGKTEEKIKEVINNTAKDSSVIDPSQTKEHANKNEQVAITNTDNKPATAPTYNQGELETSLQKVQSRGGLAKFFLGPDYGEINNAKKLLEQNREQIKQLDQIKSQLANQADQQKLTQQVQLLEGTNQQIETSLNEAQKGFSLFGWVFRLFTK